MNLELQQKAEEIIEKFKNRTPIAQIAREYDVWPDTIKAILKRNNIDTPNHAPTHPAWNKGMRFQKIDVVHLIESGEYRKHCDASIRKRMREYLILKNGHICQICKNTTWNNNKIPLLCDHIDGNAENIEITNFRNICPNCDAQLPTFKGRNKGNGRIARKGLSKQKFKRNGSVV